MSTEKFLRLLRQGDYSLILRWIKYLEERYSLHPENFSADNIIPLMVFELSNHGFGLDDMMHIEILNAVINSPGSSMPGRMECALTFLISSVMQYLVYEDYQLNPFYQTNDPLDGCAVQRWMARDNFILGNKANSDAIQIKSELLQTAVPNYQIDAEKTKASILTVVTCQNLCQDYLYMLGKGDTGDARLALRAGVVRALNDYLHAEFVITAKLIQKLTGFLNKIRELAPLSWEEDYLSGFMEQSKVQRFRQEVTRRCRFFAVQVFDHFIATPDDNSSLARDEVGLLPGVNNDDATNATL